MRVLADIFTALRLGIAAYIVYAGLASGREAFGAIAAVTLIGWTLVALVLDGRRRWVRLGILWEDTQQLQSSSEDKGP